MDSFCSITSKLPKYKSKRGQFNNIHLLELILFSSIGIISESTYAHKTIDESIAELNVQELLKKEKLQQSWYTNLLKPFTGLISSISGYDTESTNKSNETFHDKDLLSIDIQRDKLNNVNSPKSHLSDVKETDAHRSNNNTHGNNKVLQPIQKSASPELVDNTDNSNNHVMIIDKIKGIDLTFKNTNDMDELNRSRQLRQDYKGFQTEYDHRIAHRLNTNKLSRPIVTENKKFNNPFPTWYHPTTIDAFKFIIFEQDESNVPKSKEELEKELPLIKPNFQVEKDRSRFFKVVWIGHSTVVIQINGINILTDPIFSDRASPTQYFGPKRIRGPACNVKSLPKIDLVLVSHNHYDHLDADSVKEINDRFGEDCRWVVPLGIGDFLKSMSVKNYVELDWWQKDCSKTKDNITNQHDYESHEDYNSRNIKLQSGKKVDINNTWIDNGELSIYLTPNQHWSRRGMNDFNKSLWGSFVIVSRTGSKFFFAGDTAYCSAFKEVERIFGPMTGAAIPIGAYKPRWFLKGSHVDPYEAVQIHRDLKSLKSFAIHHSTFILSSEHYKEPGKLLHEIMTDLRAKKDVKEPFITLKHGESIEFREPNENIK